ELPRPHQHGRRSTPRHPATRTALPRPHRKPRHRPHPRPHRRDRCGPYPPHTRPGGAGMSLAWTPRRHRLLHAIAAGQIVLEPSGRTRWADRTVTAAVGDLWVAGLVACERTNSPVEL